MIHHWLGWFSLAICILLLAKYIGRISKNKKINNLLKKIHKPFGIAVIGVAALHGVICFIKTSQAIIQNITGLMLFISILFLMITYYAKAKLRAKWFRIHKCLAFILFLIMIIHVVLSFSFSAATTGSDYITEQKIETRLQYNKITNAVNKQYLQDVFADDFELQYSLKNI